VNTALALQPETPVLPGTLEAIPCREPAYCIRLLIQFMTGRDELTPVAKSQLANLASFLVSNPDARIHLSGHADPRGTDDYNDLLSYQRALNTKRALHELGVNPARVSISAHGSAFSQAIRGRLETYAYDRRVDIQVYKEEVRQ
jgi:outer membrane protein OmpA-like peptidoglycan-associated protein